MNATFADATQADTRRSFRPHERWDIEHDWPSVATEPVGPIPALKSRVIAAVSPATSVAPDDLYGQGHSYPSTQLSVLNFIGKRGTYSEEPDEIFEFAGWGTVRTYGAPDRDVYVTGVASQTFRFVRTPFLEGFHGHAIAHDDYAWSVNTTSLYRVTGVVSASARRARHHEPSRAYRAFKQLGSWLQMSDEELASVVKVSRTTVSASWKHGTEPRNRETARRLFQLHGLVAALHSSLEARLSLWLKHGSPCPLKVLEEGDIDRFERAADTVIFPAASVPQTRLDTAWEPNSSRIAGNSPGSKSSSRRRRAIPVRSRRLER